MKKLSLWMVMLLTIVFLVGCQANVNIDGDASVSIKEGDTLMLDITTTDKKGLTFTSSNQGVVTVDEDGKITGVAVGQATITVTANSNSDIQFEVSVEVTKRVNLSTSNPQIVVTAGMQHTVLFESNDEVTFTSSAESIFIVNAEGVITGVAEGSATLTITSVTDPTVKLTLGVTVRKVVTIEVTDYPQDIIMGESGTVMATSSEDVTYTSSNELVFTVSDEGVITPVGAGTAKVVIRSTYDENVFEEVEIHVYLPVENLTTVNGGQMSLYQAQTFEVGFLPANGYPKVSYASSDESILTINEDGVMTPHKEGIVDITVTSLMNESIQLVKAVEVQNIIVVDQSVTSGAQELEGLTLHYGFDLFSSLTLAVEKALPGANILVKTGIYNVDLNLNKEGLKMSGIGDVEINGHITLAANNIYLADFEMNGDASITSVVALSNIQILRISAQNITGNFIHLKGVKEGLNISQNQITNVTGHAIFIEGYESGLLNVYKNMINGAQTAISLIPADTHTQTTQIKVERNEISNVTDGIVVETKSNIHAYARFNSVINASGFLARSNEGNQVEFTLNHWGMATLDLMKFDHIEEVMLLGHYNLKTDIINELTYNPMIPVKFIITNPITEILVGETYQLLYEILPYDLETTNVRWITSSPETSTISSNGTFTPGRSGNVTFTVRSTQNSAINTTITIVVTTHPGIELTPMNVENNNLVGSTLTLEAKPFPVSIKDAEVSFESSNTSIATVDAYGIVSLHQAGLVTITAKLVDDPDVTTEYTLEAYNSLDENNLMDLLTKSMVTYTTPHRWTAVGVGFNYDDFKYESVSRYYFGDYAINQSKMVPVSVGIRPGEPMDPHPEGITQYNPYNVYWVVIHDTANTNPGSGALAHANYLLSNANAGVQLFASWHFTIDDKDLYQHIPETERAFHAGDGSSRPGTSATYLGGGNRNGIGIETGVNQDADVYRIWQRTAKLGADLLHKYNLPLANMRYHVDFSGKNCPQTMRNAGLVPLFEQMKWYEYTVAENFADAEISFVSDNPEYVDHTGRVIKMPDRAMTVSYTVTITLGSETTSRTFYSYLPGTVF
jgi:N-acetylmuramoyl-L-alanine amidase